MGELLDRFDAQVRADRAAEDDKNAREARRLAEHAPEPPLIEFAEILAAKNIPQAALWSVSERTERKEQLLRSNRTIKETTLSYVAHGWPYGRIPSKYSESDYKYEYFVTSTGLNYTATHAWARTSYSEDHPYHKKGEIIKSFVTVASPDGVIRYGAKDKRRVDFLRYNGISEVDTSIDLVALILQFSKGAYMDYLKYV